MPAYTLQAHEDIMTVTGKILGRRIIRREEKESLNGEDLVGFGRVEALIAFFNQGANLFYFEKCNKSEQKRIL